jgi:hypothetical protein
MAVNQLFDKNNQVRNFYMKRRSIQTFLVIAISSFILVFPAYLRCSNLAETNLFSVDLSFENSGQDDQFVDQQHGESKALVSSVFSILFFPGANLFEQFLCFSRQIPLFEQKTSILRC